MPIDSARLERIRKYNASQRAAAGMEPKSSAPTSGLRNPQAVSKFQASMRAANPDIVGRSSNTTSTALARRPAADVATRPSAELAKRGTQALTTQGEKSLATRGTQALATQGEKALATRGTQALAGRGTQALTTRAVQDAGQTAARVGGQLARIHGGAGTHVPDHLFDPAVKQIAGKTPKPPVITPEMLKVAGKVAGVAGVLAASEKAAGEFPELEKFRREESENRRVKMARGMAKGMGNTSPNAYRHETHMTGMKGEYKPIEDAVGYAVSLIQRGKNFDEARRLMQGTEKYRGMSDNMKQMVLGQYDQWKKGQLSASNPSGRAKLNQYLYGKKPAQAGGKPMVDKDMERQAGIGGGF